MPWNEINKLDEKKQLEGLYLFKSLIKDGCEWHGDICSKHWSECLFIPQGLMHQVELTLSAYSQEVYKKEDNSVWIY